MSVVVPDEDESRLPGCSAAAGGRRAAAGRSGAARAAERGTGARGRPAPAPALTPHRTHADMAHLPSHTDQLFPPATVDCCEEETEMVEWESTVALENIPRVVKG